MARISNTYNRIHHERFHIATQLIHFGLRPITIWNQAFEIVLHFDGNIPRFYLRVIASQCPLLNDITLCSLVPEEEVIAVADQCQALHSIDIYNDIQWPCSRQIDFESIEVLRSRFVNRTLGILYPCYTSNGLADYSFFSDGVVCFGIEENYKSWCRRELFRHRVGENKE